MSAIPEMGKRSMRFSWDGRGRIKKSRLRGLPERPMDSRSRRLRCWEATRQSSGRNQKRGLVVTSPNQKPAEADAALVYKIETEWIGVAYGVKTPSLGFDWRGFSKESIKTWNESLSFKVACWSRVVPKVVLRFHHSALTSFSFLPMNIRMEWWGVQETRPSRHPISINRSCWIWILISHTARRLGRCVNERPMMRSIERCIAIKAFRFLKTTLPRQTSKRRSFPSGCIVLAIVKQITTTLIRPSTTRSLHPLDAVLNGCGSTGRQTAQQAPTVGARQKYHHHLYLGSRFVYG